MSRITTHLTRLLLGTALVGVAMAQKDSVYQWLGIQPGSTQTNASSHTAEAVAPRLLTASGRTQRELAMGIEWVDEDRPSALMRDLGIGTGHDLKNPPVALDHWPHRVELYGTPNVEVMPTIGLDGLHVYRTSVYQFESDVPLGADAVRSFARTFEATYRLHCLIPLNLRPQPERLRSRFVARLYSRDEDYRRAGGMAGSSGTYQPSMGRIIVPLSSLGVKLVNGRVQTEHSGRDATLIHEISHQMMNAWLPMMPVWMGEGSAEWAAMADFVHDRFYLNQMPDQLRAYLQRREGEEGKATLASIEALLEQDRNSWAKTLAGDRQEARRLYSTAAVLVFFFYHWDGDQQGGPMKAYLSAVESGEDREAALETHLLRGRSAAELQQTLTVRLEALRIQPDWRG